MATNKNKTVEASLDRQWEIEDAMRTLQRADKIRNNPQLMSSVSKSIADLHKMVLGGPTPSKKIVEKGTNEVYSSKAAMVKHEKRESPKVEKKEQKMMTKKKK